MVKGAIGSSNAIASTLNRSAPLICAGLGVTLAFRAGLFNIGAQGQLIMGALCAGYVGFTWDLPPLLHLLVALVAGLAEFHEQPLTGHGVAPGKFVWRV